MSHSINEKCIGCTLCSKKCPVNAIRGNLKEQHVIDEDRCIDCGLCGKICAKGAVTDEKGLPCLRIEPKDWVKPVIDTKICAGCSVCVENCPLSCLSITPPKFHGDIHSIAELTAKDRCIGCSICQKTCPIGAITMA